MIQVKATREGLIGSKTATGYVIDSIVPFVALPSHAALWAWVRVRNPINNKMVAARVLDVGPWNTHDNDYVFAGARPQAESGTDTTGRPTNYAGIDLGEAVWNDLGMLDNGLVEWEFA